jgi:hypothetical protein
MTYVIATASVPGHDAPLAEPGSASAPGRVGVDTPLLAATATSSGEHCHV